MALTVNMPQLGESVTEGTIARWLKHPGEKVAKYESIAEVITDKVNAEIPAPADGTMGQLIAQEGDVVPVGQAICEIATEDAQGAPAAPPAASAPEAQPSAPRAAASAPDAPMAPSQQPSGADAGQQAPLEEASQPAASAAPAPGQRPETESSAPPAPASAPDAPMAPAQAPPEQATRTPAASQQAEPAGNGAGYHVTPAVRMLVREHGVDLSQVQGSGIGGRVTKKDVLEYVQRRDAAPRAPAAQPAPAAEPQAAPQPVAAAAPAPAPQAAGEGDTLVPLTSIRRSIAEHMTRSRHTSPHAWLMVEVDMSAVTRLRQRSRSEFEQRQGVHLTYLPFVARAVCQALQRHPTLNASWTDEGIVLKRDIHLGIAVALPDNLIVPVVRNADRLSVTGLALAMSDLGERSRGNRLKLEEIQGGTFTLNNTGALGAVMTQAIINQPQAGIMTMDAIVKRPVVVEDDAIAIRPIMNLGLSFDHRVNDGLQATTFVKTVKQLLESMEDSALL